MSFKKVALGPLNLVQMLESIDVNAGWFIL